MILVDPRWVDMSQQSSPLPDPLAQSVRDLDNQMRDILERQELSVSDKAHLYQKTLQSYLTRINQYRGKPLGMVDIKPQEVMEENEKTEPVLPGSELEKSVLESVPAVMKKKAERLLHHLKQNSDLRWNERGEISLQGQTVKHSNLIDLVNDVLRHRKQTGQPLGWETFATALSQTNIAQDLIGHPERWAYICSQMQTKEDSLPASPKTREYIHSQMQSLTKEDKDTVLPPQKTKETWETLPQQKKKHAKAKQPSKRVWETWEK